MKNVAISCRGLKKSYGIGEDLVWALKGIDLDIYDEELTLLVGPSGSGKSTLVSIMAHILTQDEGEILFFGKAPEPLFCQQYLGIVFQSLYLIPTLTVLENVMLPLLIRGMNETAASHLAMQTLQELHFDKRAHHPPHILSKGQQQRVAIARAIVNDAKIILCDEPTSALDHDGGIEVMTLLHNLSRNASKTVVVVTHDPRIFSFADRVLTLNDGIIS